jgi:hypothetical protein
MKHSIPREQQKKYIATWMTKQHLEKKIQQKTGGQKPPVLT